ncbi:MAG: TonB-dependent receptor [Pseudomonadota bacterium]
MRSPITGIAGSTRIALLASAAGFALTAPGAALAQASDNEEDAALPETADNVIIVTATKREQTLQEIPVAVSVTSAETIEQAQIRDIADLQSVVPSLRVSQLQSAFATSFQVRGFGTDGNNLGLEPSVAVFVDGVYRSRSISQISDLPNLERVEVLRGPQSTLFGKNASAGVISLVSSAPSFDLEGNVELSYGNFNALVARGYITGPLSDTVAASFAAGINQRDGFVTNATTGVDVNDRDRFFARGQLLFDNGSNFSLRLIGDYDELDEVCCAVANLEPSPETGLIGILDGDPNDLDLNPPGTELDDVIYSDVVPFNTVENWGLSAQADWEVGALTLTSITAYRDTSIRANQDVDFTAAALAEGAVIGQADIKTFTQELRLASDFDGAFNFLAGAYYFNENLDTADQIAYGPDFRGFADGLIQAGTGGALTAAAVEALLGANTGDFFATGQGFFSEFSQDNEAFSLFGQVDIEVTDRLTLTLGANYTYDAKDVTSNGNSTDIFSSIDLDDPAFAASRNSLLFGGALAQGVGDVLMLGRPATQAEIGAFAADPANMAAFGAVSAGAQAFADANENNPDANPFNALRAFQFLPQIVNIPNGIEDGRSRDNDLSYIVRANYELSDTVNAYLSYATGFKATSWNLSRDSRPFPADFAAVAAANPNVANLRPGTRFALPEESTVYEAGIKGNWGNVAANLTVFLQQIDDFQSNTFVGDFFVLANAGEQETFGIEFDGFVQVTDELTLSGAVTYLDPQFKDFPGSPVGDLSGRRSEGIHPLSTSLGATWDKELPNFDRIIIRADYQYESETQILNGLTNFIGTNPDGSSNFAPAQAEAERFTREVNNVNASVTYAFEWGLEVTAWARNLLDDRFITTIFPGVGGQGVSIYGYPNQPRTYGGTVRLRF